MREILFKAKQVGDDEWVEGYYQKRYNFLGNEEHLTTKFFIKKRSSSKK